MVGGNLPDETGTQQPLGQYQGFKRAVVTEFDVCSDRPSDRYVQNVAGEECNRAGDRLARRGGRWLFPAAIPRILCTTVQKNCVMILGERDPEVKAGVQGVDMSGQTVLVTGSTNGLGRQAAMAIGRLGADVVVHGRDRTAGESAVRELADLGSDAQFVSADYASVEDVREMADDVRESVDEIDVLCNNAGGLFDDNETTELGLGKHFHINHLSPYLLTTELLDTLAPEARIVTTSSIGHRVSSLNLDALIEPGPFSEWAAYCRSKLANIHFSNELARRLAAAGSDVTSNSFHPGIIPGSEFSRALPGPIQQFGDLLGEVPLTDSPEDGAATMTYLAASDSVDGVTGEYFARCRQRRPAPDARDETAQRDLWKRSADLLDIQEPLAEYA